MTFPILVDYTTSMYICIIICIILVMACEESCRPDERAKGFLNKVGGGLLTALVACLAHGLLFTVIMAFGVIECSVEHPAPIDSVKGFSKAQQEQFYINNSLGRHGSPDCKHRE